MFELTLITNSTGGDGKSLVIEDISDWSLATPTGRGSYGVFVVGEFRKSDTPSDVIINLYNPLVSTKVTANTLENGRYSFTGYAFPLRGTIAPSEGSVQIYSDGELYKYTSGEWVLINMEDALSEESYTYKSGVLDVPFLAFAYSHRNKLNLEYVAQVKKDTTNGASQNKLYYKRTDLDYFTSLILSAEYNWSIGLFRNYYDIVINLNSIITTGQIS